MGLPEGWITDAGLKRNEELKACGNGVVPQQAELALRQLLQGITFEKREKTDYLPTLRASDGYERRNKKTMIKIMTEGGDVTLPTWAAIEGSKITKGETIV